MKNKKQEIKFQIGKNGITEGILNSLTLVFKNHKQVRINALKSSGRDKEIIVKLADNISNELSRRLSCSLRYRIIGFTIVLRKQLPKSLRKQHL
ncbi:YhbY family RNA-binding protein [Candidatus Pacearchaeota archaeon]|nr:YhbY family RNA-binding protein [Candidatus Pacearchaeota archaeon]